MPTIKEKNKSSDAAFVPIMLLLAINVYFFSFRIFRALGWTHEIISQFYGTLYKTGLLDSSYWLRLACLPFIFFCAMMTNGKRTEKGWTEIGVRILLSLGMFLLPYTTPLIYLLTTILGCAFLYNSLTLYFRKRRGLSLKDKPESTFLQCEELIETPYSVNFKTKYFFADKWRTGYVNVVNPFRGNIIFGVPGSGKSFSILYEYMIQLTEKGFSSFTYDFKYPELTTFMYNLYQKHKDDFIKKYGDCEFISINFMDPRYSYRVNPLDPIYIRDLSDATETSTVIMKSVNPNAFNSGKDDFWTQSAINLWDSIIWYLHEYKDGRYCTFPHFIEMLTYAYKDLIELLITNPDLKSRAESFRSAMDKSEEMLQSQMSTARQPLIKMANDGLYWVFSKNEFFLDINNPKKPKFICIGNFPERQNLYSTALSLVTSRLFPIINKKGGIPSAVFADEVPTVTMQGLDNLIATARSNLVAVVLAAQDRAQLEKKWGKEEARSTLNIIGNHFYGQMIGDNVRQISELFGSEERENQSQTEGGDHVTVSTSFREKKRLPENKIATLSQGEFAAMVSDEFGTEIKLKQSCSYIQVDMKKREYIKSFAAELPLVNQHDFSCMQIENHVRSTQDESIINYLTEKKIRQEKDNQRLQNIEQPIYRGEKEDEAKEELKKMNKEEKETITKKVIEYEQKKEVTRVLHENKKRIVMDIENIFQNELGKKVKAETSTGISAFESEPERTDEDF